MFKKLFNTHTCEVKIYEDNETYDCENETQVRCDTCKRWCCVAHRDVLTNDLRRKVTLCSNCIPASTDNDDEEEGE